MVNLPIFLFCFRYYDTELEGRNLLDQQDIPNCSIPEVQEGVASVTAIIQFLNYGTSKKVDRKSQTINIWIEYSFFFFGVINQGLP